MTSEPRLEGALSAAELYTQYARFVAGHLHRLGVPSGQIDDLVQEVFIVVHQRGGYQPGPGKPTSYLATIAMHAASNARRGTRRREGRHDEGDPDALVTLGDAPDRGLVAHDDLTLVREALAQLGPTLSTTLLLADGEDEPCTSIAAAMGVPVGTVYFRLHRARQRFSAAIRRVEAARAPRRPTAPPQPSPTFARRTTMFGIFGFGRDAFEKDRAFELLRRTREDVGVELDVAGGYARHLAHVAAGTPSPGWTRALGKEGAIKAALASKGAGIVAGAVFSAVIAAFYFASSREQTPLRTPEPVASVPPSVQKELAPEILREPMPEEPSPARAESVEQKSVRPARARGVKSALTPTAGESRVNASAAATSESATRAPGRSPQAPEPRAADAPRPPPVDVLSTLSTAERLAQSDPERALLLLARAEQSGAARLLSEEFSFVRLSAQFHAGQRKAVGAAAPAFLRSYPESVFAPQVRAMLKQIEAPP